MAASLVVLIGNAARADVITPSSALATSSWFDPISPDRLIDGSGLSGVGDVRTQTHDDHGAAATMWHGGPNDAGLGGPTGSPPAVDVQAVVFTMPGIVNLAGAHIWNLNQFWAVNERGVDEFELLVSSDSDPLTASFTSVGTFNLAAAGGTPAEPAQVINLASLATNVRLVKFDINTAQSGAADEYVGLAEVRFEGTVIPEPTTGLLLSIACLIISYGRKGRLP